MLTIIMVIVLFSVLKFNLLMILEKAIIPYRYVNKNVKYRFFSNIKWTNENYKGKNNKNVASTIIMK